MAMGSFNASGGQAPMAEINTTPLVDVMLVLLIIFIITAPLLTHSVNVDLPQARSVPVERQPPTAKVAIDAEGAVSVDGERVAPSALEARLREAVGRDARSEVHLMADRATRYAAVAETLALMRRAGVSRIGFVTRDETSPLR